MIEKTSFSEREMKKIRYIAQCECIDIKRMAKEVFTSFAIRVLNGKPL